MDGYQVYVVIVDDDDTIDAQIFQSKADAQTHVIGLVLEYLKEHAHLDTFIDEDVGEISWEDAITGLGDPPSQYAVAIDFLNTMAIEDLGVLLYPRHIHRLVWPEVADD